MISYQDLISQRLYPESYTPEVIKNLQLINFSESNEEGIKPFGSYIYRVQKYPSDIDGTENFIGCCSIEDVIKKFTKQVKKVVEKIVSLRNHYITDIKIGEDKRYDVFIGKPKRGVYNLDQHTRNNIINESTKLLNQKLINDSDYEVIFNIMNTPLLTTNDYDVLFNIFRKGRVLRWSDVEVLRGYKILMGNKKITIEQALRTGGHAKIDMIAIINGKFTEITNFLLIAYTDPLDGKNYLINLEPGRELSVDYIGNRIVEELPNEIERLFYSNYYFSPFKGIKRLWAFARHNKDTNMINKLKDVISGNISLLYQLKAELGNIILLYSTFDKSEIPSKIVQNQIYDIKSRLTYVLELGKENVGLYERFDKAAKSINSPDFVHQLEVIEKYLSEEVKYFTVQILEKLDINRLQPPYVPEEPVYSTAHILPWYAPKIVNPINKVEDDQDFTLEGDINDEMPEYQDVEDFTLEGDINDEIPEEKQRELEEEIAFMEADVNRYDHKIDNFKGESFDIDLEGEINDEIPIKYGNNKEPLTGVLNTPPKKKVKDEILPGLKKKPPKKPEPKRKHKSLVPSKKCLNEVSKYLKSKVK